MCINMYQEDKFDTYVYMYTVKRIFEMNIT